MSPGNCSGSYSAPPRTRAIACRSSSFPREVEATTFSILKFAEGTPPRAGGVLHDAGFDPTQVVRYIVRAVAPSPFQGWVRDSAEVFPSPWRPCATTIFLCCRDRGGLMQ